ncbi:hypothetical protein CHUAL_001433 [Chamberlinius hualienensis]
MYNLATVCAFANIRLNPRELCYGSKYINMFADVCILCGEVLDSHRAAEHLLIRCSFLSYYHNKSLKLIGLSVNFAPMIIMNDLCLLIPQKSVLYFSFFVDKIVRVFSMYEDLNDVI